jgi:branched-chain amino acid transport system permease protein
MDLQIALLLGQDGIVNGAIYALLALALVLVFTVTRVIFIPQGEFVAYGALTLAAFQAGKTPGTLWLMLGAGVLVALIDTFKAVRSGSLVRLKRIVLWDLVLPGAVAGLVLWLEPGRLPLAAQVVLALAIVVPLGPMIYRLAYQPLAGASVLVLLIVSVAVHWALVGLGLLFFGAEGSRTTPFSDAQFNLGMLTINGQTLWVLGASAALRYARRIDVPWRAALPAALSAFILSYFGAMTVALMPKEWLRPLVLVLLIVVTAYTYARKNLGTMDQYRVFGRKDMLWAAFLGGAIGFYDGFFGPGTGSFLIFMFVRFFGLDFLRASASAKIVNAATNLAALTFFGANTHVLLITGLAMAVFNIGGSLIGSQLAIRHGAGFVRRVFLGVASLLILKFGWDTFIP